MADRIRDHSWNQTSLGPIGGWAPELLTIVNMMLASREIATVFWGPDRLMIYNDQYISQLGDRHPMLGLPLREVWPEVVDQVAPLIDPAFASGKASYLDDTVLTVVENGRAAERFYTASFEPIWVRRGALMAVEGVFQFAINNTAKVQAQRQQRVFEGQAREAQHAEARASNQLALAIDAADLATWYYDPDKQLVGGDRRMAELFGMDERVGPPELWTSKVHPDDQARVSAEFAAALKGEPYDTTFCVVDGSETRWIRSKAREVMDGGHRRFIGLCEDITLQKKAETVLLQNEKLAAVGRLASSISHEINNPLESVTNLLYIIGNSSDLQNVREYTEIAERELRRVSLIANQTLRFHKQSTNPSPFFCQDLIGDSLSIFQGRLLNSNIEVQKRKRATQSVTCLGGEIRQVLSNLIGNAIDAMPFGGRLVLRSREATDWRTGAKGLVLTVADTGTGMSATTQRKIFEPFFTTKGIGGTGLGLWISSEIVHRHHGNLKMRSSQAERHTGTVFSLFLPFAAHAT